MDIIGKLKKRGRVIVVAKESSPDQSESSNRFASISKDRILETSNDCEIDRDTHDQDENNSQDEAQNQP